MLCSILGTTSLHAQFFFGKTKALRSEISTLKADNERLKSNTDSLESLLSIYRDSLSNFLCTEVEPQAPASVSDSLLFQWYSHNVGALVCDPGIDTMTFESDVPDSVFRERLASIHSFIPLPFNDIVRKYCILYSEKSKDAMGRVLGLGECYWPMIDNILGEYGLPLELRNLVVIESRLRPEATSRVGAKGLWQFMRTTARGYGLRMDSWTDERMDPVKSTQAAARYLREAYAVYGDWFLVIASYNCGGGNVSKAMRRSGSRNFWDIYPFLPRETRNYVPAFIGALYAMHYYRQYGIVPQKAPEAVPVDTLMLNCDILYSQIEKFTGISKEQISRFNPQYLHEVIPGSAHSCTLRLPIEYIGSFIDNADSIYVSSARICRDSIPVWEKKYAKQASGTVCHIVKRGECLGKIASKYGVSVAKLKKRNHLKSDAIRPGQKLYIN